VLDSGVIFLNNYIMIDINENNFEEIISSNDLVLIDFWATWCGPCKTLMPILEEFSEKNMNVLVGKIDVANAPNLVNKYKIKMVPTLFLFKHGALVSAHNGMMNLSKLEKMIDEHL
jgi:thioredoxin 1